MANDFVLTKKHLFMGAAPLAGFLLIVFMVALISTGDAGDVTKGRKIGDVIMPEREIETLTNDEVEPPEEPEIAPPDIAPPQLDVTPIAVSATQSKPQINFNSGSGSMFRDGEYIPLFKVQPVYPRRAQERDRAASTRKRSSEKGSGRSCESQSAAQVPARGGAEPC